VSVRAPPTQEAFALTSALLAGNPYALEAMPAHLTAALELRKKNELFLRGHRRAARHTLLYLNPSALVPLPAPEARARRLAPCSVHDGRPAQAGRGVSRPPHPTLP